MKRSVVTLGHLLADELLDQLIGVVLIISILRTELASGSKTMISREGSEEPLRITGIFDQQWA